MVILCRKSVILLGTLFSIMFLVACLPLQKDAPSLDDLIHDMNSPDLEMRYKATCQSGYYEYAEHPDKERFYPLLINALQFKSENSSDDAWDNDLRACAAESLRSMAIYEDDDLKNLEIYNKQAVKIVSSWLSNPEDYSNRELISGIRLLEQFPEHAKSAIPDLIQILTDPNIYSFYKIPIGGLRETSMRTLSVIRDPVAIPYVLKIYISSDETVQIRKEAAIVLSEYGQAAICVIPYIASLLDSSESDLSTGAALIISQAAPGVFSDEERSLLDPKTAGPWIFNKEDKAQEITAIVKKWMNETGQYEHWPQCPNGLDGIPVLP